jgi:hypothetical protein
MAIGFAIIFSVSVPSLASGRIIFSDDDDFPPPSFGELESPGSGSGVVGRRRTWVLRGLDRQIPAVEIGSPIWEIPTTSLASGVASLLRYR